MRVGQVTRDRSMADNVKWILEQNPERENRVVGAQRSRRERRLVVETMGSALRRMYGREMVVFGFSFNQGSFQAIAPGGGALKNFTVPQAPPGRSTQCWLQRECRSSRWTSVRRRSGFVRRADRGKLARSTLKVPPTRS